MLFIFYINSFFLSLQLTHFFQSSYLCTHNGKNTNEIIFSGFLMKKIIDDSRTKAKGLGYKDTKVFLYSAHESNVASLLRFLGIFYSHIPPYGSYIAIEIHNIKGERGVKVIIFTLVDQKRDNPTGWKESSSINRNRSIRKDVSQNLLKIN